MVLFELCPNNNKKKKKKKNKKYAEDFMTCYSQVKMNGRAVVQHVIFARIRVPPTDFFRNLFAG